jgi:hypothetical protein
MTKQTFKIIDGVYVGPEVYPGGLDLRPYQDTLISLGCLTEVRCDLHLEGCTSLTSLGPLTKVGGWLYLYGCTRLVSLGSLKEVGYRLDLEGCTSLTSSGSLTTVGGWLDIKGCTSLVSLGSLTSVRGFLHLGEHCGTLQEVQENIRYYSSLLSHEALNALHTKEVQNVPLYKNILLKSLQGEGISSL